MATLSGLASGRAEGGAAGVVVAVTMAIIAKRASRGDDRDRSLRRVAHGMVRRWGTQFIDADLRGADFTGVDTTVCDVRGAVLTGVTWDPSNPRPVDTPQDQPAP